MAYKNPNDPRARESRRKWYYANKEKQLARQAERREEKNAYIRNAKDVPCVDCGEKHPYFVMDFDHRDPSEKHLPISQMRDHSLEILQEEIAKCDVVCSNCHRYRTHKNAKHI